MTVEKVIAEQKILDIAYPNMAYLSKHDQTSFAMVRRSGLGASDAAVYLGVNPFTTVDQLVEEKQSIGLTPHEIEVGNKENVRRGRDLESLILEKFSEEFNVELEKPAPMYRIIAHPQLTINFDGVTLFDKQPIPIEAKWVSSYAEKYSWNRSYAIKTLFEGTAKICGGSSVKEHIELEASVYGIPPYYYTQVQQQMLGLNAPFCYFAVIFDKGWEFKAFKIFQDKFIQDAIIHDSALVWQKVKPLS
jgi:hypothetical protein